MATPTDVLELIFSRENIRLLNYAVEDAILCDENAIKTLIIASNRSGNSLSGFKFRKNVLRLDSLPLHRLLVQCALLVHGKFDFDGHIRS